VTPASQQSLDRNILVYLGPVNTFATAYKSPIAALGGRGIA
jgi:hypothetical protein